MAWPFGATALLRGLAGASGAGSMAVQALLQLLPTATSGESAATSVATAPGFHQRAGASTSTPITNLILAGRIPGREQLSELDQKEKVGGKKGEDKDKKDKNTHADETDEEEYKLAPLPYGQLKAEMLEMLGEPQEISSDAEASETSLVDAELDKALEEARRAASTSLEVNGEFNGNNFSPLKSLIRPAWKWLTSSPRMRPSQPGESEGRLGGERTVGLSEGAKGLKRKRRDTPWLSRRADDPSGRRANLSEAVNAARRLRERRSRKLPIEDLFEANSSKEATAARRRTVKRIMDTLEANFPLTSRTLMEVASFLKMAGYKAGVNYLVDCKLWHVEEGHPWTELLDRTFKKCKRGLDRGKGPRRRAPEVVLAARVKAREETKKSKVQIHFARELFEFGRCWMLREAEIAILSTPDVRVDYVLKRVRLRIPVSKKDQEAEGVQRVLQCLCGEGGCKPDCPYEVAQDLLDKLQGLAGGASKLCVARGKKEATKAMLVASWEKVFKQKVTGHSARRTGALDYIRSGWAVSHVAYLGRWKSSVILQYAKEALASMPANRGQESAEQEGITKVAVVNAVDSGRFDEWKAALEEEIKAMKESMEGSREEWEEKERSWTELAKEAQGKLPARVRSIRQQVVHKNLAISVASPPMGWRTACGWAFYGSNFVFVENDCEVTCDKCKGLCAG